MTSLLSPWTFWYHEHDTKNWSKESYKHIQKNWTAEQIWGIFKLLDIKHLTNGIFFLMKGDIFPDWKSPENINGGFWSFKIDSNPKNKSIMDILKIWITYLIAEKLIKFDDTNINVQGLSLSPKNNHFVLKIWIKEKKNVKNSKIFDDNLPYVNSCKFTPFSNK